MEYSTAKQKLESAKSIEHGKPIGNNTRLVKAGDAIAVRLHETNVVTFSPDGSVILNSGGWRTVTTKARINEYAPCRLYSVKGAWTVSYMGNQFLYADGMRLNDNGTVEGAGSLSGAMQDAKLKRDIAAYAKAYVAALYARQIEAPSGGDCWGCCMRGDDGKSIMGGRGHITEHVKEKYYVPSLVFNALEVWGSVAAKHDAAVLVGSPGSEGRNTFGMQDQIRRAIIKWCRRECNLS